MVTKNQLPGIQALEFDTSNTVIVKFLKRLRPYLNPLSAPPPTFHGPMRSLGCGFIYQ